MLIITRKQGESIIIDLGDKQIEIVLTEIGKKARIGINAPSGCKIWRKELLLTMEENKKSIHHASADTLKGMLKYLK